MNKTVIISALEAQLQTKKNEVEQYETTVSTPALNSKKQEVLNWLKENVTNLVPNIEIEQNVLRVFSYENPNSSWRATTISLDKNWRADDSEFYAKMNWSGSSATLKDENALLDIQVSGAVAAKLAAIEYEFKNNWRPAIIEITNPLNEFHSEIYKLESGLRDLKSSVESEEKETYKKAGFSCEFKKYTDMVRNWDDENNTYKPYELKEVTKSIKLSTGRSNYDYEYLTGFKVIKSNKYKTTLETTIHNKVRQIEVSANKFNAFIDEVYQWQTYKCDQESTRNKQRFESYYAKK